MLPVLFALKAERRTRPQHHTEVRLHPTNRIWRLLEERFGQFRIGDGDGGPEDGLMHGERGAVALGHRTHDRACDGEKSNRLNELRPAWSRWQMRSYGRSRCHRNKPIADAAASLHGGMDGPP